MLPAGPSNCIGPIKKLWTSILYGQNKNENYFFVDSKDQETLSQVSDWLTDWLKEHYSNLQELEKDLTEKRRRRRRSSSFETLRLLRLSSFNAKEKKKVFCFDVFPNFFFVPSAGRLCFLPSLELNTVISSSYMHHYSIEERLFVFVVASFFQKYEWPNYSFWRCVYIRDESKRSFFPRLAPPAYVLLRHSGREGENQKWRLKCVWRFILSAIFSYFFQASKIEGKDSQLNGKKKKKKSRSGPRYFPGISLFPAAAACLPPSSRSKHPPWLSLTDGRTDVDTGCVFKPSRGHV